MKEEEKQFLTSMCVLLEDFLSETGNQDIKQDFDLFIKWARHKRYKEFLKSNPSSV